MLKRTFTYLLLGGLLLLFVAWFATHVTFGRSASDEPTAGISDRDLATIEERQRDPASAIDYARLDRRLEALTAKPFMVGLAVGIVEGGEIRFLKGYGEAEAGSGRPVDVNTLFRWASLSKGVAGDMIALLAEEGKLSLYEPVSKYSSSLRLPGGNEHKATISDLLSHRLGLHGHANDPKLEDGGDARYLRATLAGLDPICGPGQCHAYQNVAFDAASEVVEKVTGKPYAEAVRERLFAPLGMTSANLKRDGLVGAANWARPHRGGKTSKPVEVTDSYYRVPAAGGVNSSIKDLAIWLQAQMGVAPDVLAPKVMTVAHSPRASTPGQLSRLRRYRERVSQASYGLGWRVYDYAGHTVVGHHGGVTGYRALILFDPARKAGVVAMWNSGTGRPNGLEYEVMDMVYGLPFKDWLQLDEEGEPDPAEDAADAVDVGG